MTRTDDVNVKSFALRMNELIITMNDFGSLSGIPDAHEAVRAGAPSQSNERLLCALRRRVSDRTFNGDVAP